MWKLSIVRGLMDCPKFGHIFDLKLEDPNAKDDAVKAGRLLFRKMAKDWPCCHSPVVFFEPVVDTSDWLSLKESNDRSEIASSIADAMV